MNVKPIYTPQNMRDPAYQIRYTWSAWPSQGHFPREPDPPFLDELESLWETDGIRKLEYRWQPNLIQFTFSARPQVSPEFLAARAKGRLEHALRTSGLPAKFSRKLAVGTIGDNTQADVEAYIERQVGKEPLVDEAFRNALRQFTIVNPDVDLSAPTVTKRGRYWYNLHLVLIVQERWRINDLKCLAKIRDQCLKLAAYHGYALSRLSIVPDHMHTALRGNIRHSPEQAALKFLNNVAFALGQHGIWEPCYYAGTFGSYNMNAVRRGW